MRIKLTPCRQTDSRRRNQTQQEEDENDENGFTVHRRKGGLRLRICPPWDPFFKKVRFQVLFRICMDGWPKRCNICAFSQKSVAVWTALGWRNPKTQPSRSRVDSESAYFPKRWRHRPTPQRYQWTRVDENILETMLWKTDEKKNHFPKAPKICPIAGALWRRGPRWHLEWVLLAALQKVYKVLVINACN